MTRQLLLHQIRLNQKSFWRNPESAFFTFAMPLGVLLIFGATSANDTVPGRDDVDVLTLFVPGILAFAIVVVAYGNLAATIALQRADGVLKRIRATPLDPNLYLGGQILSVLATTLLISATTIASAASSPSTRAARSSRRTPMPTGPAVRRWRSRPRTATSTSWSSTRCAKPSTRCASTCRFRRRRS